MPSKSEVSITFRNFANFDLTEATKECFLLIVERGLSRDQVRETMDWVPAEYFNAIYNLAQRAIVVSENSMPAEFRRAYHRARINQLAEHANPSVALRALAQMGKDPEVATALPSPIAIDRETIAKLAELNSGQRIIDENVIKMKGKS